MGACPREYQNNKDEQIFRCKQDGVMGNIEDAIIDYIDGVYEKDK